MIKYYYLELQCLCMREISYINIYNKISKIKILNEQNFGGVSSVVQMYNNNTARYNK